MNSQTAYTINPLQVFRKDKLPERKTRSDVLKLKVAGDIRGHFSKVILGRPKKGDASTKSPTNAATTIIAPELITIKTKSSTYVSWLTSENFHSLKNAVKLHLNKNNDDGNSLIYSNVNAVAQKVIERATTT